MARAGTTSPFHFGQALSTSQANWQGSSYEGANEPLPVGHYPANDFGLHDVHGNVGELVADCWQDSHYGAPADGSAWWSGTCGTIVVRGGSWFSDRSDALRAASRARVEHFSRLPWNGFRVAGMLDGSQELLDRHWRRPLTLMNPRSVAVLLKGGASATAANGAGWTALHEVAAWCHSGGCSDGDWETEVAGLLLDAGADVNAATDIVGWTPLHLAATSERPEIVQALLARGADPNARTRVGGWTPLTVASRKGAGAGVIAALKKAGGREASGDGTPFSIPRWSEGDWVPGSFTRPGARERLVFDPIGDQDYGGYLTAAGVVDERGAAMLGWISDRRDFLGLCRDAATDVDHVMVKSWAEGSCCANELEVWAHDPVSGALGLAYSLEMLGLEDAVEAAEDAHEASSAWPEADGRCRWRERKAAEDMLAPGHGDAPSRLVP